jgi:hypothetical protein
MFTEAARNASYGVASTQFARPTKPSSIMVSKAFMRICRFYLALFVVGFCAREAAASDVRKDGLTRFEIFGMKDEYMMLDDAMLHDFDGQTIERFYPSESEAAAHFEKLLPAYCVEEGIGATFVKKVDSQNFTYFISPIIAEDIRRHYDKGILKKSEFGHASWPDLMRYVLGAYARYNYKRSAIISAANSPYKIRNLAVVLSRLGCSDLRCYVDDAVPTSNLVVFTPTKEIRQKLGIKKTISFAELNRAFGDHLKLRENFDSN